MNDRIPWAAASVQRPLAAKLLIATCAAFVLLLAACSPIRPGSTTQATGASTGADARTLTVTPEIVAQQEITATVLVNSLNLRAGPAREHTWLGNVRQRNVLTITGMVQECAWLQATRADGLQGWVAGAANLVQTSVPCSEIPEVAQTTLPTPPPTATATRAATATPLPTATATMTITDSVSVADTAVVTGTVAISGTAAMTDSTVLTETLAPTATLPLTESWAAVTLTVATMATETPVPLATPTPPPTATYAPTPSATPTPLPATIAPATIAPATATPQPGAVEIPDGMGCVQIGNYVGPELTISFTHLATGEGRTETVAPNQERLFCMEPGLYTVTADAPPPFDTADFTLEIVAGEAMHIPLFAR